MMTTTNKARPSKTTTKRAGAFVLVPAVTWTDYSRNSGGDCYYRPARKGELVDGWIVKSYLTDQAVAVLVDWGFPGADRWTVANFDGETKRTGAWLRSAPSAAKALALI